MSLLLIVPAALLLPNWVLLTFCIPVLMVISYSEILPEIFSIGDADLRVYDIVLLIVIYKIACASTLLKRSMHAYRIYSAITIFIIVLFETTIIAYYHFGVEVFWGEIVSLLRFVTQISTVFLLTYSINNHRQLILTQNVINYLGYLIAVTVYVNVVAVPLGVHFGEVHPAEGMIRYFGPIGDQVGFLLLFFIYKQLIGGHLLGALFLGGAIVATGTIGAIVTMIVGLTIMAIYTRGATRQDRMIGVAVITSFAVLLGLLFVLDFGSIQSRFITGNVFEQSGAQRLLTFKLAVQTFWENLLTGVGFTGFRYHVLGFDAEWLFIRELEKFSPVYIASASNQFLQVATDGGLIGLTAFGWLVMACLRTLKSTIQHTNAELQELLRAGYVWFLALLVGAQTAAWLLPGSLIAYLLWLILGVALAARKVSRLDLPTEAIGVTR